MKLIRAHRRAQRHGHAALLERIATGALWPGDRRHPAEPDRQKCPRCAAARHYPLPVEDIIHQQWLCPCLAPTEHTAFDLPP
eukprot:683606-Pyramimonas_sp.AAC.1